MKEEAPENLELKYQLAINAFLYRVISSIYIYVSVYSVSLIRVCVQHDFELNCLWLYFEGRTKRASLCCGYIFKKKSWHKVVGAKSK